MSHQEQLSRPTRPDDVILHRETHVPYNDIIDTLLRQLPHIAQLGTRRNAETTVRILNIAFLSTSFGPYESYIESLAETLNPPGLNGEIPVVHELNALLAMNDFEKHGPFVCSYHLLPHQSNASFHRALNTITTNASSERTTPIIANSLCEYSRATQNVKPKDRRRISTRITTLTDTISQLDPIAAKQSFIYVLQRLAHTKDNAFAGNYRDILLRLSHIDDDYVDKIIGEELDYEYDYPDRSRPLSQEEIVKIILETGFYRRPAVLEKILPIVERSPRRRQLLTSIIPDEIRKELQQLTGDKKVPARLFFCAAIKFNRLAGIDPQTYLYGLAVATDEESRVSAVAQTLALRVPHLKPVVLYQTSRVDTNEPPKKPSNKHLAARLVASLTPAARTVVMRHLAAYISSRSRFTRSKEGPAYVISILYPQHIPKLLERSSNTHIRNGVLEALTWLYRHSPDADVSRISHILSEPPPAPDHTFGLITQILSKKRTKPLR